MYKWLKDTGSAFRSLILLCMFFYFQPVFAYNFPSSMPPGCTGGNGNYTCNSPPMNDHWFFDGDTSPQITVTVNGNVTISNYTFGRSSDMLNDGSRSSRITVKFYGDVYLYAPTIFMNLELHGNFSVLNGNLPALIGAILSPDVGKSLTVAGGVNYVRSDFGPITINGGSGTGISAGTCIQATTSQPIYNNTNNWPSGSGVCCGTIDGTCSNSCVVNGNGVTKTPSACTSNPASLLAKFTMEEQTAWNGTSGELKDTALYTKGPFNGQAIGSPVPVQGFINPARSGASNGTCQYALLNGPSSNGGAFAVSNMPVNTSLGTQNSVTFWMYWNGDDAVVPLGWSEYKLAFKNNLFGFDPGDGRMYARSSTGLANGWHHVSAVFTNIDITSNKLYIDGTLQTLSLTGTQKLISFFNPDSITTNISPPATWGTGKPPAGWFTDNPSGIIEVNPPSVYGATGATSNNVIEIEANPGDYNLYTIISPDPGEQLTLSLDYAGRPGYMAGTDSEIDVYINNVLLTRLNTQSSTFQNFTYSLGIATGNSMKVEFRSVDKSSYGGLLTNIQVFRNRAVATSAMLIGGVGSGNANRFMGNLDEVNVYKGGITQAQVNADYAATHQCLMLHHARLDHNGSGVTCAPAQIAVRGCSNADLNGVCTPSVVAFTGTVVAQNNGVTVASAPFSIPAGQSFALVQLNLPNAQTTTLNVVNYNIPPYGNPQTTCWDGSSNSPSCQFVFNDAGFILSTSANGAAVNIPNQVAGVGSGTYYLRAVQKNTTTSACQAALTGNQSVNFGYVCNNPTTCSANNLMTINGASSVTIAKNNNASGFTNTTAVPMMFDANGNAPFSFNFLDAGQTTLFMQKTINGANLAGNSNAFVTKPFNLSVSNISTISNIANPAASDATGAKFVKAGQAFQATVTALAANGNATPNFGNELTPEVVSINSSLVAPSGGAAGSMSGNTTAGVIFSNGSASLNTLKWSEVGIIQLTPALLDNDYLGAGSVTGISSGNVGRFYPDHFSLTAGVETKGCSSQFTYFGQDGLNTAFTLTAQNTTNGTTQNYTGTYGSSGSFMKFNTSLRGQYSFSTNTSFTLDPSATAITGTWLNGVGSINAKHIVRKPSGRTAPTSITFNAHPTDDDGVTINVASAPISSATPFRYGRMFLQSMHGSELLALPMQLQAQFWDGNGYARNTLDSCSGVALQSISMKNYHGNLNACETQLTGLSNLVNGIQSIKLTPPGVTNGIPNTGSVDLEVNLNAPATGEKVCVTASESNATNAGMPWLLDNGIEPLGRATFGRNRVPTIYMRENF